mgnify:CR=1 FL=1
MNTINSLNTLKCYSCGNLNAEASIFCSKCISPLNVKKLNEMTVEDLVTSSINLISNLPNINLEKKELSIFEKDLLLSFLSAFWLRPETALYQAAEAAIVAPIIAEHKNDKLLDLGCGNGINSSILAGWRFKPSFDVFEDLDLDGDDIYDSLKQDTSEVEIEKNGRIIDFGVDIKKSMVQRAKLVGSFESVLQAEAAKIPVGSNSVGVVYSNVIRDFDSNGLDNALSECARIIKPGGSLIFSSPTPEYQERLFYYTEAKKLEKAGRLAEAKYFLSFDRGRSEYCTQQISIEEWKVILNKHGFEIKNEYPLAGEILMSFWDTGLRPFTPVLIQLLNQVDNLKRQNLKKTIINFSIDYLSKMLANDRETKNPAFRVIHAYKT